VAAAAKELGITPDAVRSAILRGRITPVRLDGRTNLIARAQVDKYKAERGRPAKTDKQQDRMPLVPDLFTVAEAAAELGLSPATIRGAIRRKTLAVVELDKRTKLIPREELERYKRERRGRHGKRPRTENAPKHQECPRASRHHWGR
jgi:excisionase family DNA binding protein